jgi:hypothetical protein
MPKRKRRPNNKSTSKKVAKPGYGDQGDQPKSDTKKGAKKAFKSTTKKARKKAAKK